MTWTTVRQPGWSKSKGSAALTCAASVVVATLLGRGSWFTEPYGVSVDESTYMALGDLVARGGIPYLDALDRKPPGIFWMFSAIAKVFGPWNIHAVHATAFLMTILLSLAAASLGRRFVVGRAGQVMAAVLFALYSACFTREIISCNAEYPMLICCAGVALCLTSSRSGETVRRSVLLAGLAGVLAALATLFKQYGILVSGAMMLAWVTVHYRADRATDRSPLWRILAASAAFIVGAGGVVASVIAWFHAAGGLAVFWDWAVSDGFRYMQAGWRAQSLRLEAVFSLAGIGVGWLVLWVGIGRPGPWRRTLTFRVLALGGLAAWATTLLSGRSFAHYYLPIAWFASVLAVPGLRCLWREPRRRAAIAAVAIVPLTFFAVFNTARDTFWAGAKFNRARQAQLEGAARWIRAHTEPAETIAVWGASSQLYPMSERGSGTRHVFADFVSGRQPGFDSGATLPVPGALATYLADLERNRPAVFVDTSSAGINDYGHFPVGNIPALDNYVRSNYCLTTTVGGIDLWTRRGKDPGCVRAAEQREQAQVQLMVSL
jgi:hypothetical protein